MILENKIAALLLITSFFSATLFAQVKPTFETATEAVQNMHVGWNLGNTLDSHSGDTLNMWIEHWTSRMPSDYEKAWGQPVTRAVLFKMLHEAGFNAVRIPVTWYPHMEAKFRFASDSDSHWSPLQDDLGTKVNRAWLRRVKQVVDYIIAEGMYCILNVHHDTGADNTAWLIADGVVYAQQRNRFEALWTQIAEEFRDYDEHLLFEGYNEMLDSRRSWCFASFNADGGYNAQLAQSAYNAINSYAQSFVNAVRATGGNNLQRNLVVCTYGACDGSGSWNTHLQDPLKEMLLPTDSLANHLIFEVHCYPNISNLASAKNALNTTLSNLKRYLVKKGAPVIFGEWGISGGGDNRANHVSFVKYFAQRAKLNKVGLFYWMGLSDGTHRAVPEFNEPDLLEAMMEGYYGKGGYATGMNGLPQSATAVPYRAPTVSGTFDLSGRPLASAFRSSSRHIVVISDGKKQFR